MTDLRSILNLNGIPMQGWVGSGESLDVYQAVCTADMASFTTEADITGCSVSVVFSGSNNSILAIANIDMSIATSGSSFSCFFNWNGGADSSGQCLFVNPSSVVTNRFNGMQTWVISGITAGTYTAKLRASCTSSNVNNKIHGTNNPPSGTTLTVLAIGNS